MMVVGLTGGIGSGKTTVAGFFKEKGVPVYIADDAGKRLLETSAEIREKVIELIGEEAYHMDDQCAPIGRCIAVKVPWKP